MTHQDELVIYLPDGAVAPPTNPYGRLVANAGVYRALARYGGYRRLHFQCRRPAAAGQLARELSVPASAKAPAVTTGSPLSTAVPEHAGVLLSGQPYLSPPAWVRRHAGRDAAYSISGTIFAFSSAPHRELMLQSLLAPLYEWDALICSSPTLRDTVLRTLDGWEDHLRERLEVPGVDPAAAGRLRLPRPQLPVIPFGVDVDVIAAQAADGAARRALREAHGVADGDVVVCFLGRLSYFDKAFPQAMFKAVAAAQAAACVTTHLVMTGWFPAGAQDREQFEQAARRYAPGVNVVFLDGNDRAVVAACWAAADVFLLLSDTIIETFGQALTEAMAAGLPLVVSDWDGYRSIARDGVDGFLVPTLGAPAGPLGETLALLETLGVVDYPQYAGTTAQHTAVHVGRTAEALTRLIASPGLRATMGAAGRRRARELFAWPVVVGAYQELFAELAERRARAGGGAGVAGEAERGAAGGAAGGGEPHRMPPLRNDPFADFRGLPTMVLTDRTDVRLTDAARPVGSDAGPATGDRGPDPAVELDRLFPTLRATPEETEQLITALSAADTLTVGELVGAFPPGRRPFLRMTLLWLAKAGVVDWLPEG
jgi:glycosyltransferase involved in cell wall biosynthesis